MKVINYSGIRSGKTTLAIEIFYLFRLIFIQVVVFKKSGCVKNHHQCFSFDINFTSYDRL